MAARIWKTGSLWIAAPAVSLLPHQRPTTAPIVQTDRIELAEVLLILSPNQSGQIVIRGLPEGVTVSDLMYSVDDPGVATVVQTGKVRAVKAGDAIVTISDPSETYKTSCHIHVRAEAA